MTMSRAQIKSKIERLKRLVSTAKGHDRLSSLLLDITRSLLEIFMPFTDPATGSESSSFEMPNPEDVGSFLKDSLPAASFIFTDDFFTAPVLPMTLLFGVAEVFGCGYAPSSYVQPLELIEEEKKDSRLMIHVWLCYVLDLSKDYCHFVIRKFKAARGPTVPWARSSPMDNPHPPTQPTQPDFPPTPVAHPSLSNPLASDQTQTTRPSTPGNHNADTNTTPNIQIEGHEVTIEGLPSNSDDSRKANYVQMMFKDSKFTGDLSQDIQETLKMYSICGRQYGLSGKQKADFFVHIFDGAARKFFFHHVKEEMPFNVMTNVMLQEYLSDARQLQVKGSLETLRLRSFMAEKNISDVSEGLSRIVEHVNALSSQCPPDFRSDAHKIDYLRKAVTDFQAWSRFPIQNITSQGYSFTRFVTTLHESIQNLRQIQLYSSNRASSEATGFILDKEYSTNIAQYGRNPGHLKKRGNLINRSSHQQLSLPRTFEEARRRNQCFKCGSKWCPGHKCSKGAILAHARNRIQRGESAVYVVADLAHELETDLHTNNIQDFSTMYEAQSSVDSLTEFDQRLQYISSHAEGVTEDHQHDASPIEKADQDIFITQIESAMNEQNNQRSPQDFQLGGEDQ